MSKTIIGLGLGLAVTLASPVSALAQGGTDSNGYSTDSSSSGSSGSGTDSNGYSSGSGTDSNGYSSGGSGGTDSNGYSSGGSGSTDSNSYSSGDSGSGSTDSNGYSSGGGASGSTDSNGYSSDASSGSSSSSSSSSSSGDSAASTEPAPSSESSDDKKHKFYAGVERVQAKLDVSKTNLQNDFRTDHMNGAFELARVGYILAPGIAIEGQGRFLSDKCDADKKVNFNQYYAAYFVTTGIVAETVELSARIGGAYVGARNYYTYGETKQFAAVSYGVEAALPLRVFSESLPDIRFVIAATVLTQSSAERSYGYQYGLRYDFGI